MSAQYFVISVLVPWLTKKATRVVARAFKLQEMDARTQDRVRQQRYPRYYAVLYGLWVMAPLAAGCLVLWPIFRFLPRFFPDKSMATFIWVGLINVIGGWFLLGAFLDAVLWRLASGQFKDYVRLRQLESGTGYEMPQQVAVLVRIGGLYYLIGGPLTLYVLLR